MNLIDLLDQYRNCYIDLKAYSKYCGSVLLNLTLSGEVAEYSTQFYHNPLLSTHIELITFSKALRMKKPNSLFEPSDSSTNQSPKKGRRDLGDDLGNFNNINDLRKEIENMEKQQEAEAKEAEVTDHHKIHLMM